MALQAQVPLLLMIIWGAQRVWTKGGPRRLGRSRIPITVAVGEPLAPAGSAHELTTVLHAQMDALLHAGQDGYGHHPPGAFGVPHRLGGGAPSLLQAEML